MRRAVGLVLALLANVMMVMANDYYAALGVPRNADANVIKRAYRKMSLKFHPDKAQGDKKKAEQKFAEIARAYEVLSDPKQRKAYDQHGEEGLKNLQRGGGGGGQFNPFDIFRQFGFGAQGQQQENVGPSIEMDLKVSLRDIYLGKTVQVLVNRVVPAESASNAKHCRTCTYMTTEIEHRQLAPGFVQQVQKQVPKEFECCEESDTVTVEVERGAPNGHVVDFEGYGEHNPTQTAGKISFKMVTQDDALFRREGDDLHAAMSITLKDALLGFSTDLIHVDGHKVRVQKDTVTQPGERMMIRGEGMPQFESPSVKGDLHITFSILFPHKFDAAQKAKLLEVLGP